MTDPQQALTNDPCLAEAAPLGRVLAEQFCNADCREYHGVWGFLRLYGVLPAVSRDADFVRRQVADAAAAGARQVLISGAADFGILSHVAEGFAEAGKRAEITVADLCPTPLKLNEWYAAREGLDVTTAAGNIFDFRGGQFDLILAHNFLNFFPESDRDALAAKWAELLSPGGSLLVYNRVKPGAPEQSRRFDDEGTANLIEKLRRARQNHLRAGLIGDADLFDLVTGYARKKVSHNVRSQEELLRLMTYAGLEIASCRQIAHHAPGVYSDRGGALLEVVARRPIR